MRKVPCSCCHGNIFIEVVRDDLPGSPIQTEPCFRCERTGQEEAEEFYMDLDQQYA